jgi:hypothetical protein
MPGARKAVAVLCIAIVIFAALVPSAAIHFHVVFTPLWLVVPAIVVVLLRRTARVCHEQPSSLLRFGSSRAPPAALVVA